MKNSLTRFHFSLLAFLILHFIIAKISGFGFSQAILFMLKIILYLTGMILFILYLKPFKKGVIYFSYYIITPVVTVLGALFGGIFLVGILMSVLLIPIFPKNIVYEKDNIVVYTKFQGFLGACCTYEIYQRKYVVFEKYHSEMQSDGNDFPTFEMLSEKEMKKLQDQLRAKE
jgi:hypothetical protein